MTNLEFSSEFDISYNSVMGNTAPPLDEYEKSVFLTTAQEQIIKNYFNPKGNKYQEGFDDSQKRQLDFYKLVEYGEGNKTTSKSFDSRGVMFELPSNILLILSEVIKTNKGNKRQVVPIHFEEYNLLMNKPFKYPLKNQAWRLLTNTKGITAELIAGPNEDITEYKLRYVKRPSPIILVDLDEYGMTIDGIEKYTECELDPILHREILDRAVELAKMKYEGDIGGMIELNSRNE